MLDSNVNEFVTLTYIVSYPGILFLAWSVSQFLKQLIDKLKPDNKTRYVVLLNVVILVSIRSVTQWLQLEAATFDTMSQIIVEWMYNIPLIWLAIMKAHEVLIEKKWSSQ